MDTLSKLFGSPSYVKIMRLFLCNPDTPFETRDVTARAKTPGSACRRDISRLYGMGMVRRKDFIKKTQKKTKRGTKVMRRKAHGWVLNQDFPHNESLRAILVKNESFRKEHIAERLKGAGNIKLLVASGVFMGEGDDDELDILIVGDRLKKRVLDSAIRAIESEMGRELRYAALRTGDFLYRLRMCDKFVRNILDYPHEKLIQRIDI